ncbi:DNA-formamidopyrimidine glycosylase family protein [Mucilaginibacter arboris]|uniref:Fpg/Nei family DNA glycosylase n=1 Tax=Mucilaginibacter arboris TaxID=2682090 RepID=A0A7K1SX88_9SPHI|nr:DNA-formamidopyrimidine glycosylase family protein [Mucilaginibacter arboris]MVN21934.1 Fpg/Nei family DNA glycosylase [Mucilaginibacter arboris]
MPELPDLEVISKNLNKLFAKKTVNKITIYREKKLNAPVDDFYKNINGKTLKSVKRNGKELLLNFSNDIQLGIHLMLNGEIHLLTEQNIKHQVFEILFEDLSGFAVTDYMAQAKPILNPVESKVPDALDKDFNFDYLKPVLAKSASANIKKILKDQEVVRGIGNAYADEILWAAKVAPRSKASKIPDEKIKDIIHSTKTVLADAIDQITKIAPDTISGEIRSFLKVHTANPKTPTDFTINRMDLNGSKTYFTDEQKVYE